MAGSAVGATITVVVVSALFFSVLELFNRFAAAVFLVRSPPLRVVLRPTETALTVFAVVTEPHVLGATLARAFSIEVTLASSLSGHAAALVLI